MWTTHFAESAVQQHQRNGSAGAMEGRVFEAECRGAPLRSFNRSRDLVEIRF
jgi:hypothetical protein